MEQINDYIFEFCPNCGILAKHRPKYNLKTQEMLWFCDECHCAISSRAFEQYRKNRARASAQAAAKRRGNG